jgi:hypothetical protein
MEIVKTELIWNGTRTVISKTNKFKSVEKVTVHPKIENYNYLSFSEDLEYSKGFLFLSPNCFYIAKKQDNSKVYFYFDGEDCEVFENTKEYSEKQEKVRDSKKVNLDWFCHLESDGKKISKRNYFNKFSIVNFGDIPNGFYQTELSGDKILLFVENEKITSVSYSYLIEKAVNYPYIPHVSSTFPVPAANKTYSNSNRGSCKKCGVEYCDDYCENCGS